MHVWRQSYCTLNETMIYHGREGVVVTVHKVAVQVRCTSNSRRSCTKALLVLPDSIVVQHSVHLQGRKAAGRTLVDRVVVVLKDESFRVLGQVSIVGKRGF